MTISAAQMTRSDKAAVVGSLYRLGAGGRPLAAHVQMMAERYRVNVRTVYRWLKDESLAEEAADAKRAGTRKRFQITTEHLAVLAQERTGLAAWSACAQAGLVECSYATFMRALAQTDPAVVGAAVHGRPGLVNNRLYLRYNAPHRNHTFHIDHTELDMWVWPDHRSAQAVRPHVTVIVDSATGLVHAVPWTGRLNSDMVAAALAEATTDRTYFDVRVGGLPEQIVLDNAAEHFGPTMRQAVESLGIVVAPTAAYSSWQNGKAERAVGLLNRMLADRAPGASHAGTTRTGAPRHVAPLLHDMRPEHMWSWKAFCHALQEVVDTINTEIPVKRLGGKTRLAAYAEDPTPRRALSAEESRIAMLMSGHESYKAGKQGIKFRNNQYVGPGLKYGHRYTVRYLPTLTDFIEVFDEQGHWVCRAENLDTITPETRATFLAERQRQEREAAAIEAGIIAHRRHLAALPNEDFYGDDDLTDASVEDGYTSPVGISDPDGAAFPPGVSRDEESLPASDPDGIPHSPVLPQDASGTPSSPQPRQGGPRGAVGHSLLSRSATDPISGLHVDPRTGEVFDDPPSLASRLSRGGAEPTPPRTPRRRQRLPRVRVDRPEPPSAAAEDANNRLLNIFGDPLAANNTPVPAPYESDPDE